ncbi:CrcB family protein [Nocardioides cavernae]|uniref:fluoride efflux transporter FluC n=1 Tax=Nocardioides TaxID=1839 RepID=UPI0009E84D61|nr:MULTISPECIES: CrcB family protein [Nocardioides]MCK9823516.1 CrcB family protein [Nocardioides cavernae]
MPEHESLEDATIAGLPIDPDVDGPGVLRSHADVLAVIAAGGALGSVARWAVGEALPADSHGFPWSTFVENCTGAFALGALMVLVLDVWPPHRYLRPFLGVGVLGGYTTFSTYMLDARGLLAAGHEVTAFAYLAGTLLVGLLAVWLGIVGARATVAGARRRRRSTHHEQPDALPTDQEDT